MDMSQTQRDTHDMGAHIQLHAWGICGGNQHAYQDNIHAHTHSLSVTQQHPFNDSNPMHLWEETGGVAPQHTLQINMCYLRRLTGDKDNGCNEQIRNTQSMQNGSQIGFLVFKELTKKTHSNEYTFKYRKKHSNETMEPKWKYENKGPDVVSPQLNSFA